MIVRDEVRTCLEEQFADCTSFEEVALLYSDFQVITRKLMYERHKELIEEVEEHGR